MCATLQRSAVADRAVDQHTLHTACATQRPQLIGSPTERKQEEIRLLVRASAVAANAPTRPQHPRQHRCGARQLTQHHHRGSQASCAHHGCALAAAIKGLCARIKQDTVARSKQPTTTHQTPRAAVEMTLQAVIRECLAQLMRQLLIEVVQSNRSRQTHQYTDAASAVQQSRLSQAARVTAAITNSCAHAVVRGVSTSGRPFLGTRPTACCHSVLLSTRTSYLRAS